MRLLLHCCCGPCTLATADHWRAEGAEVRGWFFNPNLHPRAEHRRRQEAFLAMAEATGLPVQASESAPDLVRLLLAIAVTPGKRCLACYHLRLEAAARAARRSGCEAFSTTLLISPYQDLAELRRIGEEVGAACGVRFAFADLRSRFRESQTRAQQLGLYRQSFCGCPFSDLERAARRAQRAIERVGRT